MNTIVARAFTLVELLVTIAVITVLIGILAPSLHGAKSAANAAVCGSNLHQLGIAWAAYAHDFKDRAMPLAYWEAADIGDGPQTFWWGTHGTPDTPPGHDKGFIAPYLSATLAKDSVFECPAQRWGTYRPQGPGARWHTSTYGYNGYYLSPSKTPGWGATIGHRPWRRIGDILRPGELLVFADTLLAGNPPSNNALLDPPQLYAGPDQWVVNQSPTTAFRHAASTMAVRADGSARATKAQVGWLRQPSLQIGSIGADNDPAYVPDWRDW